MSKKPGFNLRSCIARFVLMHSDQNIHPIKKVEGTAGFVGIARNVKQALQRISGELKRRCGKVKTGFEFLDLLINGYSRAIHTFYGEAGTFKTTILLKAAAEASQKGKVYYIDPKHNFSIDRMLQISTPNLENVILLKEFNQTLIKAVLRAKNTALLIIDPVTAFWKKDIAAYVSLLTEIKLLTSNIPVLMSAEVYTNIDDQKLYMKSHGILVQFSSVIVELEKRKASIGAEEKFLHVAICRKHPSERKEGQEADFTIGGENE